MFLISILLVIISSYLIASSLKGGKNNFIYFMLIVFSQIILTFEMLSLFSLINKGNFLISNFIIFLIALFFYKKINAKLYIPNLKEEYIKIKNSLKLDKTLCLLFICFCCFIVFQLISALFFPITFGDAVSYYLPRCTAWIQNGNIHHYITPDSRELIMPTNMEFLYTWVLLFRKSEMGISVFSYLSYILGIYITYNFLKELGYSVRKRLWSIFVISAFALLGVEMHTPCADLFIGVLILCSIYLFVKAAKYNDNKVLFFASLSYALAVGTKTTAIIAIPSLFIIFLMIIYKYNKNNITKQMLKFCLFFIVNFLVFSSYNYILNFIQFSNPVSCSEQLLLNQFRGGFKGWISNLIKYCFSIFDTSGIVDLINWNGFITYLQSLALSVFGLTDKSYTSPYFARYFPFNSEISMTSSALGVMGLFAFLPSLIKSIKYSKKNIILFSLGLTFIFNIFIFSRVMVFTQFNMRYLLTFVVIASPIVVYSYIRKNNLLKILMSIFLFTYLLGIVYKQPMQYVVSYIKYKQNVENSERSFLTMNMEEVDICNFLKENKIKNVALIINQGRRPVYYIYKARLFGINIDQLLLENIERYNLNKYEYIITNKKEVRSTNIVNFEDKIKYPALFVSECTYMNNKQETIVDINEKPVVVNCKIPFDYFSIKGFEELKTLNLNEYSILKKI